MATINLISIKSTIGDRMYKMLCMMVKQLYFSKSFSVLVEEVKILQTQWNKNKDLSLIWDVATKRLDRRHRFFERNSYAVLISLITKVDNQKLVLGELYKIKNRYEFSSRRKISNDRHETNFK